MREESGQNPELESKSESLQTSVDRLERRRLIRAAVVSVPVVLTFSAGTAHAQDASVIDSALPSPDTGEALDEADGEPAEAAQEEEEAGPLTPAEELETFGLERVERPEGYSQDPFRNLDSVHPEVNFDSP